MVHSSVGNSIGSHPIIAVRHLVGSVLSFDRKRGRGEIEATDGCRYPFHAVSIVDGTRDIEAGTLVRFDLGAGLGGRWEADGITAAF
jgi:cold shock CspA family protein